MNHIFISYSREDSVFAETLQSKLEEAEFTVWRDTGIRVAEDWRNKIDKEINEAFAVIVLITPSVQDSQYVAYESAFAMGAGVKVIPIMLRRTEKLPPRLEPLEYLDFTDQNTLPWKKLIESLHILYRMRVEGLPPLMRVHGYSGEWKINTEFKKWQGRQSGPYERILQGSMFLLLSRDGKRGSGTQIGKLFVQTNNEETIYQVANQITSAEVAEDGTLSLGVQVLSRMRIKGDPLAAPYSDDLLGDKQFHVTLQPAPGHSKELRGRHKYPVGAGDYQDADETYTYVGGLM